MLLTGHFLRFQSSGVKKQLQLRTTDGAGARLTIFIGNNNISINIFPHIPHRGSAHKKNLFILDKYDSAESSPTHAVNTMCDAAVPTFIMDIYCLQLWRMIWRVGRGGGG